MARRVSWKRSVSPTVAIFHNSPFRSEVVGRFWRMFGRYKKLNGKKKAVNGGIFYRTPIFLLNLVSVNCTKVPENHRNCNLCAFVEELSSKWNVLFLLSESKSFVNFSLAAIEWCLSSLLKTGTNISTRKTLKRRNLLGYAIE